MARHHMTANGPVPFTPEEEAEWDAMEAAEAAKAGERLMQSIVDATQQRLDDFARTRNYDSMLSLCTYATSSNVKFQAEGLYGVDLRDATWAKCYHILTEVQLQLRPMPTGYADIEAELPVLAWP